MRQLKISVCSICPQKYFDANPDLSEIPVAIAPLIDEKDSMTGDGADNYSTASLHT